MVEPVLFECHNMYIWYILFYHLYCLCIDFYDLHAWCGCWICCLYKDVYLQIFTFFFITRPLRVVGSWLPVVNPTDCFKSVRNRRVIKFFGAVLCCHCARFTLCWYRGFYHKTESDLFFFFLLSKVEKVPRGIQGEKSSKDIATVRGIWSQQLEHKQVPKRGTEPDVRKGKRALLARLTRCKCSMETTQNSVKVKFGIKVIKLVESPIGWDVPVCQGSECHLTFVRGRLHIAE